MPSRVASDYVFLASWRKLVLLFFYGRCICFFQPVQWQKKQDAAAAVTVTAWQSKTVSAARQFLVAANQENDGAAKNQPVKTANRQGG